MCERERAREKEHEKLRKRGKKWKAISVTCLHSQSTQSRKVFCVRDASFLFLINLIIKSKKKTQKWFRKVIKGDKFLLVKLKNHVVKKCKLGNWKFILLSSFGIRRNKGESERDTRKYFLRHIAQSNDIKVSLTTSLFDYRWSLNELWFFVFYFFLHDVAKSSNVKRRQEKEFSFA
jgi:hypothetical protein